MKLFQLADDPETYQEQAGWWLVVSDDLEKEISNPFPTEEMARIHLNLIEASEAVLDNWSTGDLAAAVRKLDTALAAAKAGRQQ